MTYRTLLIGGGWANRNIWLPRLGTHPAFEVVGVVDPDPTTSERFPGVATWPALGAVPDNYADFAVIATPNASHAEVTVAALRKELAVLVEKPTCLTDAELDDIETWSTRVGRPVLNSTAARYRTDVLRLAGLIDSGALGTIRTVEVSWVRAHGVPRPGSWFTSRSHSGGGALIDLGWHVVDIGLWLSGWPKVVASAGVAGGVAQSSRRANWFDAADGPHAVDVEDSFVGFLATTGPGLVVKVRWASHSPVDVTSITVDGDAASVTLSTTFGFSTQRVEAPNLRIWRDGVEESIEIAPTVGSEYDRAVDHAAAVLDGRVPDPGLAESRAVLQAVLLLYASDTRRAQHRTTTSMDRSVEREV